MKLNSFRKAVENASLLVIGVAIGMLVLIGLYLFSQDMMGKTSNKQGEIMGSLTQGIEELKK